jgi:putative transposase
MERVGDFRAFLSEDFEEAITYAALRKAEGLGRPVGSVEWLRAMEEKSGRALRPGKRGPKPKVKAGRSERLA